MPTKQTRLAGRECGPQREPGRSFAPPRLTDPGKLRALAHPARIVILQFLALAGPATATECAEIADLSPSACSYHLRELAKHGFVAEDRASAADGRQRPWRARLIAITGGDEPAAPIAVRAADRLLTEVSQARFDQIRTRYLDREADYDPAWRQAAGVSREVLHLTADELATVRSQLHGVLAPYRRLDGADRPADARRALAMFDLVPWFAPQGRE